MSDVIPVLTLDGPSGVGKGTVARILAAETGWHLLDSGALYRILALAAIDAGIELDDTDRVAALAPALEIEFVPDAGGECIRVDGQDLTARIRDEATGGHASVIAAEPAVRAALLTRQRAFRRPPGLVADGRDMGTVVFADAAAKVFLDASAEERARRRAGQLLENGVNANLDRLCEEIRARDERDRTRAESPLRAADDALIIDTSELAIEEVVARVRAHLASNPV